MIDCIFEGTVYKNQLKFAVFGEICRECECRDGNILCQKVPMCPRLPCSKPLPLTNRCCPVCMGKCRVSCVICGFIFKKMPTAVGTWLNCFVHHHFQNGKATVPLRILFSWLTWKCCGDTFWRLQFLVYILIVKENISFKEQNHISSQEC